MFRGSSEKNIRKGILEDDLLESVIGLPPGLFYGTNIPAVLLIINKNKSSDRKGKVLFINGELDYQEGKNQNKLKDADIQKIIDAYETYKDIQIPARKPYKKGYAKVVSIDEIQENDYNLNIRRYADTSPPPELFDTKAVLNGGIPISEVEDEYIQWILKGADVSSVFIRRDNEYYDFKPEIETKEQIRDHLCDVDESVITQIERWWDKYHVSLHKIDTQVKESEKVMRDNLKELGYE